MKYELVNGLSDIGTYTYRLAASPDFRPSATSTLSAEDAIMRAEMEELEGQHATDSSGTLLGSAAHSSKEAAVSKAQQEAVERIVLSNWWARDLTTEFRIPYGLIESYDLLSEQLSKSGLSLVTGLVNCPRDLGLLAVSIIQKQGSSLLDNPSLVLGASYGDSTEAGVIKSSIEAIHSWIGTVWYAQNGKPIYWDTSGLSNRNYEFNSCKLWSGSDPSDNKAVEDARPQQEQINKYLVSIGATTDVVPIDEGYYVARVDLSEATRGQSLRIAEATGEHNHPPISIITPAIV